MEAGGIGRNFIAYSSTSSVRFFTQQCLKQVKVEKGKRPNVSNKKPAQAGLREDGTAF
jgi:hypothetical protein